MKKGELWILELPSKGRREQSGTRPCLILADTQTNMIIVIPLTSNFQALRFPNTLEIKKSYENKLERNSVALIFQIQSLDKRRFKRKIGILEENYVEQIKRKLKELLN